MAGLPYFFHLHPTLHTPQQDEVAVRLTQREPGAADWRAANVLTQYYSAARYL